MMKFAGLCFLGEMMNPSPTPLARNAAAIPQARELFFACAEERPAEAPCA